MPATINDLFNETRKTTSPTVTTVQTARSIGGTSLVCADLTGWPTNTAVHFITYKKTASGLIDKSTQCAWKGIVSSNTINTLTLKSGTDAGNAIGDFVEMGPTAAWGQDLISGLEVEHSVAGVHALTSNSTITNSKVITGLNDTNAKQIIAVSPTDSAVNNLQVANAATGNGPTISAIGTDSNIDINLSPKGTGTLKVGGNPIGSGAWQSWTPSWTNLTVGNATQTGYYTQIGKTVIGKLRIVFGSTTTISSNVTFSLPVTMSSHYEGSTVIGSMYFEDSGNQGYPGLIRAIPSAASIFALGVSGSVVAQGGISSTAPFTWGTGDYMSFTFTYEAA